MQRFWRAVQSVIWRQKLTMNKKLTLKWSILISIKFNSNVSATIANLKTSSNKVLITVPYKADRGSDGNIMQLYKKVIF